MISVKHAQFPSVRTLAGIAVLAACVASAWPRSAAAAQPLAAIPSVAVQYNAADLSTKDGASKLYERIALAARQVCPNYDSGDLAAFSASRSCQRRAIASAVEEIGSPRLAAVSGLAVHVA